MDYIEEYTDLYDKDHVFKEISYEELIHMFDTFESGLVMLGGPWCPDTQAIITHVNRLAKKRGLKEVYNYDPRFLNEVGEWEDLRSCLTLDSKMKYYDLVEKSGFSSSVDVDGTLISRIPLPTFMAVRNGKCVSYYSCKYVNDNGLHNKNSNEDETLEFAEEILSLIDMIKQDNKLC